MSKRRKWPHDLPGLAEMARNEILPEFRQENDDPTRTYPTNSWLNDARFSHLRRLLKDKHDMNVETFFTMIVGVEKVEPRWGISDPETVKRAEEWLDWNEKYRQWVPKTRETKFYHLKRVFTEFVIVTDHEAIIDFLNSSDYETEMYDWSVECIHRIREKSESDESAYQSMLTFRMFVNWLDRRSLIEHNPAKNINKEFIWKLSKEGPKPLTLNQVGAMWEEASDWLEYMAIIGYVFWGLRRQELTNIHKSQMSFENEKLKIEFEENQRKSGAGTVTAVIGVKLTREFIDQLSSKPKWSGHLYVDLSSPDEPIEADTAADIFSNLCDRAGVYVDGNVPTPNNGRATWHDVQTEAEAVLMEMEYTDEQAYEDDASALRYQGEDTKEDVRRMLFKQKFKKVLPDQALSDTRVFADKEQYSIDEFR